MSEQSFCSQVLLHPYWETRRRPFLSLMRCGAKHWSEESYRLGSACALLAYLVAAGTAHAQSDAQADPPPPAIDAAAINNDKWRD